MPAHSVAKERKWGRHVGDWWASGRALSQLLAFLCLAGVLWLFLPYSAIRSVEVTGHKHLTAEAIAAASYLLGRSPYAVNTGSVASHLIFVLPLRSASVTVRADGTAVVSVEELTPALVWESSGRRYLVAADGRLIAEGWEPDLPVVEGTGVDLMDSRMLPEQLAAEIVQISGSFPQVTGATIAVISYSNEIGISVQTKSGWQVRFGRGNIANKLKILRSLLAQQHQWTLLDLRFGYRPFFK
jgi:cell division septal protein FtsQ